MKLRPIASRSCCDRIDHQSFCVSLAEFSYVTSLRPLSALRLIRCAGAAGHRSRDHAQQPPLRFALAESSSESSLGLL